MSTVPNVLVTIFETVTLLLMQHSISLFAQVLRVFWVSRTLELDESESSLMARKMKDANTEETR